MEMTNRVLAIDVGNTTIKLAFFVGDKLEEHAIVAPDRFESELSKSKWSGAEASAIMGSGNIEERWIALLPSPLLVDASTPSPLKSAYTTPDTLGLDRKCNAIASMRYGNTMLAIDLGTCITYDLTHDRTYMGGAISPGWRMRLKAMHDYTDKLPLIENELLDLDVGSDTRSSMLLGAQLGIVGEIEHVISRYSQNFNGLQTVITGGDGSHFVEHLNCTIFADPYLTLTGLYEIYKYQQH